MHIPTRTTSSPYGVLLTRMRCIGRIEILVFVRYRPGDPQQFSRRCAYSYLARLTRSTQTAVERFDHWIMLQRTQCRENRSEEHTSELQSLRHLVCRLLLEKKNIRNVSHRPSLQ